MSDEPDPTLSSATLAELCQEIGKRYESAIVVVERDAKNDPEIHEIQFWFQGGYTSAVGLASRMQDWCLTQSHSFRKI